MSVPLQSVWIELMVSHHLTGDIIIIPVVSGVLRGQLHTFGSSHQHIIIIHRSFVGTLVVVVMTASLSILTVCCLHWYDIFTKVLSSQYSTYKSTTSTSSHIWRMIIDHWQMDIACLLLCSSASTCSISPLDESSCSPLHPHLIRLVFNIGICK